MRIGESHGDVYILIRGDMNVLNSDRRTFLFKIPEGTVFGEGVVLRRMEVRRTETGGVCLANRGGRTF